MINKQKENNMQLLTNFLGIEIYAKVNKSKTGKGRDRIVFTIKDRSGVWSVRYSQVSEHTAALRFEK